MSTAQPNRILITPASNVLAHAGRCVVLGRALKQLGHYVAFAGTPRYLKESVLVEPDEFEFWPLDDFHPDAGLDYVRTLFRRPAISFLRQQVQDELAMLDAAQPDVVVCDFRLTMYISARLRNIPVVSMLGGGWLLQFAPKPVPAGRSHLSYALLAPWLGPRLMDRLAGPVQRRFIRWKLGPYRTLARQFGLQPPAELWDWFIGEHNLVLDTELMAPALPLPEHFTRVGPICWNPALPVPAWLDALPRNKPLVYLTMGSTGHPKLFARLISLLSNEDCSVAVSTGGQVELDEASLPPNVSVERFLPGVEVMKRADLVIFHGGAGTAYQAIEAGTPAIVVATHFEQELAGHVFEQHEAGLFYSMHEAMAAPDRLRDGVHTILSSPDRFRAGMAILQRDFQNYNPVPSAAACIDRLLRENAFPPSGLHGVRRKPDLTPAAQPAAARLIPIPPETESGPGAPLH